MLVIIVAGSLYGLLDRLNVNAAETSRVTATNNALKQAREALLAYAAMNKGLLPCPDMASDDVLASMIGTGAGSCSSSGSMGLLPVRNLGLPDLRDGDGNCLWYALSGTHRLTGSLPPTDSTVAQYEVVDTLGNMLVSKTGGEKGAAALVVAPGMATEAQARTPIANKTCGTDSSQASTHLESTSTQFTTGTLKSTTGTLLKNDQLAWVTATQVRQLAQKLAPSTPCNNDGDGCDGND
ncbi:MAG: hypothetical protein K2Q19_05485 [Rhodocyclaceae bacterium]|nr:hypothetical protein [Rhodocyclaceae bacterium]